MHIFFKLIIFFSTVFELINIKKFEKEKKLWRKLN